MKESYKEITKIHLKSFVKVYMFIMGIMGAILGLVSAIISVEVDPVTGLPAIEIGFNFLKLVLVFVMYLVLGALSGLVGGYIYNLAAKKVGGIRIELK